MIDLMEALRRSVEDAKQAKQPAAAKKAAPEACAAQIGRALAFGTELVAAKRPWTERSGSASAIPTAR